MLAGVTFLMTSCLSDDDSYSLDNMWVGLGVVDKDDAGDFTMHMDDGSVLFPSIIHDNCDQLEDSDRVLINYTILSDKVVSDTRKEYYVKINSVREILKKGIIEITPAMEDSIGNDAAVILDAWVSRNQFLNVEFQYYGRSKVHFINLVRAPGALQAGDQPIELEFRHNDNDDVAQYPMKALVSFDLGGLQIQGLDSVRFRMTSVDYDEDVHTFEGVYRY